MLSEYYPLMKTSGEGGLFQVGWAGFTSDPETFNEIEMYVIEECRFTEVIYQTKMMIQLQQHMQDIHKALPFVYLPNRTVKILSDKSPEEFAKEERNKKNEAKRVRKFKRYMGLEFEIFNHTVRIVTTTTLFRFGVKKKGDWKYFRSFQSVLKSITPSKS